MRLAPVLAVLLLAPLATASTDSKVLLDAEGTLLAGAGGLEVGDPADEAPVGTEASGPITHAVHPFAVPDCPHFLLVEAKVHTLATDDDTWERPAVFDPVLVEVEIRTPNGTVLAGEFGQDFSFITNETVAPDLELHVVELVGGPATYQVEVTGLPSPSCNN